MLGQRWEYRIGNSIVMVDNAFSWTFWAQERLIVNDETAQEAGGRFGLYRSFGEAWLTHLGEGELRVVMTSQIAGIACSVTLDRAPIEPEALWEASWRGARYSWPQQSEWVEARGNRWMA
ncbi:MAG: hypothetical protein JNJ92_06810 [Altererythrobacter sp.]|nr:hypothetical protein [Altererythrobacter sp.]